MQEAVAFVTEHPGVSPSVVVRHFAPPDADPREWQRARGAVERVIRDRLVCQTPDQRLFPWDAQRKAFADLLERAYHAAPTPGARYEVFALATRAWRAAGDENRARVLEGLHLGKTA
jgi:hypothetical protein